MKTKVHVLLIGYSKLSRKRLVNYLIRNKIKLSIASKSYKGNIDNIVEQFSSYDNALKFSKANIVYISLPNSLHYVWAKKALNYGYHVIVDKPICENYSKSLDLVSVAKKKNRLISEATFFNYHNQIKKSLTIIKNKKISKIHVNFTIPLPPKNSILLSKVLYGGVIMDMAPYAAAIHRIFLKKNIIKKKITIKKNKNKLPVEMNLKLFYENFSYKGKFKFGGKYKNQIEIFYGDQKLKINRAFSPPEDENLTLELHNNKSIQKLIIKKDNCFRNYFKKILNSIKKRRYSIFYNKILVDQKFRDNII